jgi:NitT/TauT family transport system permease protein
MSRRLINVLLPVVMGIVVIELWIYLHFAISADNRFLLPRPDEIYRAFVDNRVELVRATLNTTEGAIFGFLSAVGVSLLLAVALSLSRLVRVTLYPYLMILQMTPIIVLAPILVLWIGAGLKSVVVITFLICFFPLVVNTTQGLISTDRNLVELFRMYRASRFEELWLLRLPSALPNFFTGLRISAVLAPIGALVGDYTAGSSAGDGGGLGFQTIIYSSSAKYPALFATAAIACVLGFLFVAIVVIISWLALHQWHDAYERKDV